MGYSWEDVMLFIDVKDEAKKEQKQSEAIHKKQLKEQEAASMWSLGLSLIGGALFGPPGYFAGKKAGEFGADYAYDWESMTVDPGKFNKEEAIEFNKTIAEAASDQTKGQALNTVMDLATMYVQAGGLKEGFDAGINWDKFGQSGFLGDWGTFGVGNNEWSVLGRPGEPFKDPTWASEGSGGMLHPVTGKPIGSATMPTGTPGVPSLLRGEIDLKSADSSLTESPLDILWKG